MKPACVATRPKTGDPRLIDRKPAYFGWLSAFRISKRASSRVVPPVRNDLLKTTSQFVRNGERTSPRVRGALPKVNGGAGDQAAGGVGNGIVRPGLVSSTIGSSGVVFAYAERVTLDPLGRVHTFCHAVPGAWHVMGVTQGAGLSLRWFRDNFGDQETALARWLGLDPYELLTREAEQSPPGAEGLFWLPYLMGERTPHLDATARAVLFGLTARHRRSDVLRAILEGVAYSLRDSLEILREMGVPVEEIRASGGGGRSALWRQIQADVFGYPLTTINAQEGPAFGVALLAGVGVGLYPDVPSACAATIRVTSTTHPIPENVAVYARGYQVYRALYPALKAQFAAVADLVVHLPRHPE